jgi:hypothetical protein
MALTLLAAVGTGCTGQTSRPLDQAVLSTAAVIQPDDATRAKRNLADSQLGYALLSPVDAKGALVVHPLPPRQGQVVIGVPLTGMPLTGSSLSLAVGTDNACLENDVVVDVGTRSKGGQLVWSTQALLGPDHRAHRLKVEFNDHQDAEQLAIGVRMAAAATNNFCAAVAVRELTLSK